jgi:hypothetical protein
MLGDQLFEETGRTIGTRVLADGRIEVSFQDTGTVLGVEYTNVGTYVSSARPDGALWGEGQGVAMTKDGEMVSWRATGVGAMKGRGWAASWRGVLYCQTASQKLARLNKVPVVYENEVDENGNQKVKSWEWK